MFTLIISDKLTDEEKKKTVKDIFKIEDEKRYLYKPFFYVDELKPDLMDKLSIEYLNNMKNKNGR